MLNDKGLYRAMVLAYKMAGYMVGLFQMESDEILVVSASDWTVVCPAENFPRKCLGLIVEHAGMIPKEMAVRCMKDFEQCVLLEVVQGCYREVLEMRDKMDGCAVRTPLTIAGLRVWQDTDDWNMKLMDPAQTAICNYGDDDVDVIPTPTGLLFDGTDAYVWVRQVEGKDYEHILKALAKQRI